MGALGIGLGIGGGLLNGIGGFLGGQSRRRAAETIRQDNRTYDDVVKRQLGGALFGDGYQKYLTDLQFATSELLAGRPDAINNLKIPPEVQRQLTGGSGSIIDSMTALGNNFAKQGQQGYNAYNRDTAGLQQQTNGLQAIAANYGRDRNAVIDADSKRMLDQLNGQSMARLNASGLGGSTLTTQALAGNTQGVFRESQRAKADAADQKAGMQLSAGRTALDTSANRAAGRSDLYNALMGQRLNLRMMPLTTRVNALSGGPLATPYRDDGAGIINNSGGLGNTLAGLGNAAAGLGGFFMTRGSGGSGMNNSQFSSLLDAIGNGSGLYGLG